MIQVNSALEEATRFFSCLFDLVPSSRSVPGVGSPRVAVRIPAAANQKTFIHTLTLAVAFRPSPILIG